MSHPDTSRFSARLIQKAHSFSGILAGITRLNNLIAPSSYPAYHNREVEAFGPKSTSFDYVKFCRACEISCPKGKR